MRYPRRRPSMMIAAIAVIVGAGFLVDAGAQRSADIRAVDTQRSLEDAPTDAVESATVKLRDVPATALDLARSGLGRAGITLPRLDLSQMPVADDVPAPATSTPSGAAPSPSTTSPSATSPSTTSPSAASGSPSGSAPSGRRPVGALVKHLVRDTPFKMVGFTWTRPVWNADEQTMLLRAKQPNGRWGDWIELEPIHTSGEPSARQPGGTEPVWVGGAKEIQVALAADGLAIPATLAAGDTGSGLLDLVVGSGAEIVKNLAGTVFPELTATLLNPDSLLSLGSSMLTTLSGGPQVISRAAWGADESIRCSQPSLSPTLRGAIVHHTAGSNDYTPQQSAEIVRGIYAYHARTLNWCDIGYNVLVDKYGQTFEGAFGGLDRNVEGTHTGGFNRDTVGLSMIGNLDEIAPSGPMIASAGRFLKWRLNLAGLNPAGTADLTSEYFSDSKFPAGTQTHMPMIAGHRDYNNTSCPGILGYPALTQIRGLAGAIAPPPAETQPEIAPSETEPVAPTNPPVIAPAQ
ncbi:N-acetylmuramoyl-L-alanine amidase [Gordonia sp. VNK1]